MNILFVHERYGALGGAEANILVTARELGSRGHRVGILHGPGTGLQEEQWDEVFDWACPHVDADPASLVALAVGEFRADVVYVHKTTDLGLLEALLDSGLSTVRMVHDHDLYCMRSYRYDYVTRTPCTRAAGKACIFPCLASVTRHRGGGLPIQWNRLADKQREIALNRRFDRLLVASRHMEEQLLLNGFSGSQIEIHAPVPRMVAVDNENTYSDRNLVLYTGQIIRGKGVDMLLRALARVQVPFECIILGDGNHRARCEQLARRLGLADRVRFPGFVPQEDLDAYYRDASVMAVSSLWPEPFGAVGLEAMRHRLPVVAFDAGGIRDWLHDGQNGFLVPHKDVATYAERLEQLLNDKPLARAMGEAGWKQAARRFRFDDYVDDLEALFQRLAGPVADPGSLQGALA